MQCAVGPCCRIAQDLSLQKAQSEQRARAAFACNLCRSLCALWLNLGHGSTQRNSPGHTSPKRKRVQSVHSLALRACMIAGTRPKGVTQKHARLNHAQSTLISASRSHGSNAECTGGESLAGTPPCVSLSELHTSRKAAKAQKSTKKNAVLAAGPGKDGRPRPIRRILCESEPPVERWPVDGTTRWATPRDNPIAAPFFCSLLPSGPTSSRSIMGRIKSTDRSGHVAPLPITSRSQ